RRHQRPRSDAGQHVDPASGRLLRGCLWVARLRPPRPLGQICDRDGRHSVHHAALRDPVPTAVSRAGALPVRAGGHPVFGSRDRDSALLALVHPLRGPGVSARVRAAGRALELRDHTDRPGHHRAHPDDRDRGADGRAHTSADPARLRARGGAGAPSASRAARGGGAAARPDRTRPAGGGRGRSVVSCGGGSRGGVARGLLAVGLHEVGALAEVRTPSEVARVLEGFYITVTDVVFAHGGSLEKPTGDGVIALFGAPVPQKDHATRAVAAAMALRGALKALAGASGAGEADFKAGVGVASGEVVVGAMGPRERNEYTAVGATVDTALALERLDAGGVDVLLAERTYRLLDGRIECELLS